MSTGGASSQSGQRDGRQNGQSNTSSNSTAYGFRRLGAASSLQSLILVNTTSNIKRQGFAQPSSPIPIRIAYLAGGLDIGGAERQLVNQAAALTGNGHSVSVLTLGYRDSLENELNELGVSVRHVGKNRSRVQRLIKITKVISAEKPDLIHSQHFHTNLYAALVGRLCSIPALGSLQNAVDTELQAVGCLGWLCLRCPNWLTANSKLAVRRASQLGCPPERLFYIANAVDLKAFGNYNKSKPATPRRPMVLTIGRLVPQKRIDRFLQIVAGVRIHVPNVLGLVVGEGPQRSVLETQARGLALSPYFVRFLGQRNDVPRLLAAASIFILSSDHEGCPNVVQEAMAAGVPVVSSAVGGVPDVVVDGVTGFLSQPENVQKMIEDTCVLLQAPALQQQVGNKARLKAFNDFSVAKLAQRLNHTYSLVLGNKQRQRLCARVV